MSQPILISLFNHKGGVSKTTTTFNLGWTLANRGIKTLIVDTDPQCNLTAYVLGLQLKDKIDDFYKNVNNDNLHKALNPIVTGLDTTPRPAKTCKTLNKNLFLLAGHLHLSEIDIQLAAGLQNTRYLTFARQFIGSIQEVIRKTAKSQDCQVVLIDMSPSSGALNRSVLMGSDYFLVPTSPDFFCFQATQELGSMLSDWNEHFKEFRKPDTPNALPKNPPKMIGIISQKYRTYTRNLSSSLLGIEIDRKKRREERERGIAKSYQHWIDKIQEASNEQLAKALSEHKMVIDRDIFMKYVKEEKPYNLVSIGDFNSLVAISQEYNKPIFELESDELNFSGKVLEIMQENQQHFREVFEKLADRVIAIIDDDLSRDSGLSKYIK